MSSQTSHKRPGEGPPEISPKKQKNDIETGVKPALPKELTKLFQPLYCDLCKAQLSSPLTASVHYSGKPHQKKIKTYLSQNFPHLLPIIDQTSPKVKQNPISNDVMCSLTPDQAASCRICNVVFAGSIAAQAHYVGKKHRSKVLKGYTPIEPVKGMDPGVDETGRFGIGESFLKNKDEPLVSKATIEPQRTVQRWYCNICDLQVTDDNMYKQHLEGKRHKKNCNKLNINITSEDDFDVKPPPVKVEDSILSSVNKNLKSKIEINGEDYSIHRTPSGNYYCKICNITLNSLNQFISHTESKKHKKKKACVPIEKK